MALHPITMKALVPILTVVAALCGVPVSAKQSPASGVSSSGVIAWSVDPNSGTIFLNYASGAPGEWKLCSISSTENLRVDFSPDDRYVFVTDGTVSRGVHVTLYKRGSSLKFSKVDFSFSFAVQRLALAAEAGVNIDKSVLTYTDLRCLGWTRNGTARLKLSGSGRLNGKTVEISGFDCEYNPVANSFSS